MKIKLSKNQWQTIGQRAGWIKREALSFSSSIPTELEKELKRLAISYSKNEMAWEGVVSRIVAITKTQPKFKDMALDTVVDFINRISQYEKQTEQVFASKKINLKKNSSLKKNAIELGYDIDDVEDITETAPTQVYDISTGEMIDITKLSFEELVHLYNGEWFELDPKDFSKVEAEVVSRQSDRADRQYDTMRDNITQRKINAK